MIKNIINFKYKDIIPEALLLGGFALLLFTNQISNYSSSSYLIKAFSLIFAVTAVLVYDRKNPRLTELIKSIPAQHYIIGLFVLIVYPAITIVYSLNPVHGLLKTGNMLISNIPLILFFYYLVATFSPLRKMVLVNGAIMTGLLFSLIVLVFYPFNHYEFYKFEPDRLSHVMVGRILGICYLVILLSIDFDKRIKAILPGVLLALIGYASYLTALRASVLGLGICVFIYVSFIVWEKKDWGRAGIILGSVVLTFIAIEFTTKYVSTMPEERFGSFEKLNTGEEDGAIKARYYLYNRAVELIKDNPLLGVGYGGYAAKGDKFVVYPHNFVLEAYSELGAIGGTLFLWLIILALYRCYKYDRRLFIYFIYPLILAMFSKDLTTNGMLMVVTAIMIIKDQRTGDKD
ncbi:MAG: O-antigen ligase family protein [Ignavibacteriaceae bacterium]|nr:O-antigen ligase family protein [Ignavibacteriaceae bacterium]